jgi:hypothetical protein
LSLNYPLKDLAGFYYFLVETAKGFVKNAAEREKQVDIVLGWQRDVEELEKLLTTG